MSSERAELRPPRRGSDFIYSLGAGALVLVFCLILLWHNPHIFFNDDYEISILPVFADVARSWSEGHWPLLSPYSWVCSNLAGEYQYGTFSVFVNAAVILIWKLPLAFWHQAAALSIAHLFVLAMGGYVLARGRNVSVPLAVMVGLVAALNGWNICWGATDWFGAIAAFAWLPWSWWALEFAMRTKGPRWRVLAPAPFIYLLLTGGFPYTIVMLGLITVWLSAQALVRHGSFSGVVRMAVGWAFGIGLSAPAWLSLLEYAAGSRRSGEKFLPRQWLVPIDGWPGLVVPTWSVSWRTFEEVLISHPALELACGLAPIVVIVVALVRHKSRLFRELRWELGLLAVLMVLASVPMAGFFRFSFRWLPLIHVLLALLAAEAFQRSEKEDRYGKWAFLFAGSVALAMALFGLSTGKEWLYLPLSLCAIALLWWLAEVFFAPERRVLAIPAASFAALLCTYLLHDPHPTVAKYWFSDSLNHPAPLDPDRLYLSLYPAPQAYYRGDMTGAPFGNVVRPGSTSMFGAVHLINGYSPVGPAGVARLFDFGTHGQINPARLQDTVLFEAAADGLLEKLGIDGIIVAWEFSLPTPLPNEWKQVYSETEGNVYHRAVSLPHVRALEGEASIKLVENSRQKVVVDATSANASQRVLLAFSRPYFPGYHAMLNGHELTVTSFRGLIPTVELPAGESGRLELVYRPKAVTVGSTVAIATLLVASVVFLRLRR